MIQAGSNKTRQKGQGLSVICLKKMYLKNPDIDKILNKLTIEMRYYLETRSYILQEERNKQKVGKKNNYIIQRYQKEIWKYLTPLQEYGLITKEEQKYIYRYYNNRKLP